MSQMFQKIRLLFFSSGVSEALLKCLPKDFQAKEVLWIGSMIPAVEFSIKKRFPKTKLVVFGNFLDVPVGKKFDLIFLNESLEHPIFSVIDKSSITTPLDGLLETEGCLAIYFSYGWGPQTPIPHNTASYEPLSFFNQNFSKWEDWSFLKHRFVLYRHFGRGNVGDPMPEGYVDRQQSRMNLEASGPLNIYTIIGSPGRIGLRAKIGVFVSEDYYTDEEPILEKYPFPRIIRWQSMTILKKQGWRRHIFPGDLYQKGVGLIHSKNKDSYYKEWSKHAQRHREKWLREELFKIEDVTLDEFSNAYHASKKLDWLTRTGFVRVMKFHKKNQKNALRLFGVRDLMTNEIVAGLAVTHFDDIHQSFHTVSFICDKVRQSSVGVGLIDHWYQEGIKEGIKFFNFGIVWRKGDPRAWKGYSKFKRQFNLYLIAYPKPFFKFVWGKRG